MTTAYDHLLIKLDGSGCSRFTVGGKAAGLDRLAAHGFPIPVSFALSTQAYRDAIEQGELVSWLAELNERPVPGPSLLAAEEREILGRFAALPLPRHVEEALVSAVELLLESGTVAVRSSATAEDLGTASFAGQYRTLVRLESIEAVLQAVRTCWASLWLPAAREYRKRHNITQSDLAMAVVIQAMVEAEWSGVGFTQDPSGHTDVMRIEVVPGIGEALVSGAVTPLDFTVHKATLAVTTKRGGEPPMFIEDLARMLLRAEDEFDEPLDVEWSWVPGRLILLQARAETVSGPTAALDDGFDKPINSADAFTPQGVVEMLPGALSPLLWSVNAPMIEHGFRTIVTQLGGPSIDVSRPFVGRFQGRAALNLSALREVAEAMPGGTAADVEEQFLGRAISPGQEKKARPRLSSLLGARRTRAWLVDEVQLVREAADGLVDLDLDLESLPAARLLAYGTAVRELAWRITSAEVATSSAAAAAYRNLEMLLKRWMNPGEASMWAQRLSAGALGDDLAGSRLDTLLRGVWEGEAAGHPDLDLLVREHQPDHVPVALSQLGAPGESLLAAIRRVARLAGSKAIYGGASWAEDTGGVWRRLRQIATSETRFRPSPGTAMDLLASQLTSNRRWRVIRVLTGQVIDLRLRWIERQVQEAMAWFRRRELAKTALLTLGGEERRIIQTCARRLVASSHLSNIDEIWLYSDEEVRAMTLRGTTVPPTLIKWRRAAAQRCDAAPALPEMFVGAPDRGTMTQTGPTTSITGWAGSPGRVTGGARVVHGIAEADRLEPGEILVAEATDPSWTPVLAMAAGIVLETGGPLSHGAIVAREFGIPAVLCATRATSLIMTGETIEVDGHSGLVHRRAEEVAA